DNWLALVGKDVDFVPPKPFAKKRSDIKRAKEEWDKIVGDRTDAAWGYSFGAMYKQRWTSRNYNEIMAERYGKDNKNVWNPNDRAWTRQYQGPGMGTGFWKHDSGGTLNAVYQFLRDLGVRWYMPGQLGEVVPELKNIQIPEKSRIVKPDFRVRKWMVNRPKDLDGIMWRKRIGIEGSFESIGYGGAHGLSNVLARKEMKQKHPEYYALVGGKRITHEETGGYGEPCFSSEGLVNEAVKYVSFRFDVYGENMVQLSPPDGLRKCQCDGCKGLSDSDMVFSFLNKVAKKLYEKYPEKILLGSAYATYVHPPESVDKFSPNFAVSINNRGRPIFTNPEKWNEYWSLLEAWRKKLAPQRLIRVDNNRYEVGKPMGFPRIHPQAMAKDLKALKGICLGDRSEISIGRKTLLANPGNSHITLYVSARFLWDADQDINKLLDEYYEKFYGPASIKMKEAFTFAEFGLYDKTVRRAPIELKKGVKLVEMLHEARDIAGDTIYGKRIQFIIDEYDPLEKLKEKLATKQERGKVPGYWYWNLDNGKWRETKKTGKIDGKLEEKYWRHGSILREIKTKDEQTGKYYKTRFSIMVGKRELRIGVRCDEDTTSPLKITSEKKDDMAILNGDRIEIMLDTGYNSYYRMVINPAGALLDIDMAQGEEKGIKWDSNAEAASYIGDGFWSAELRIPLVPAKEGAADPLHDVVYRRSPTKQWPWYFNIARIRVRDNNVQKSAFSVGEDGDYLNTLMFGKLAR
ncbi:MAG: DUF4838 domain-containing protein, partial [Candidatus Rifleibacteriota bacterium]